MTKEEVMMAKALRNLAASLFDMEKSLSNIENSITKGELKKKKLEQALPKKPALEKSVANLDRSLAGLRNRHYELYKKKFKVLKELEEKLVGLKYAMRHRFYK